MFPQERKCVARDLPCQMKLLIFLPVYTRRSSAVHSPFIEYYASSYFREGYLMRLAYEVPLLHIKTLSSSHADYSSASRLHRFSHVDGTYTSYP